jgi:hypothetical protein
MAMDGLASAWCALGVLCAIASAACTVIGMLMQKAGLARENRLLFRIGVFVFTILKPATQIVALYLAPVMLIAPLASVSILLNAVIAPYWQGGKFGMSDALICAMLLIGCVGTTLAGAHDTKPWSFRELDERFAKSALLTAILFGLTLALSFALKRFQHCVNEMPAAVVIVALIPSMASALNNVLLKVMLQGLGSAPWYALAPLVASVAVTAFLQVWSTTVGVKLFDMLTFVPIQVAEQILVTTSYSIVFFADMPADTPVFIACSATIALGVFISQWLLRDAEDSGEDKYTALEDGLKVCPNSPEGRSSTICPSTKDSLPLVLTPNSCDSQCDSRGSSVLY